jgi:hypothetical protein
MHLVGFCPASVVLTLWIDDAARSGPKQDVFTIYDLKNKFIAYTTTFTNISYIVSEWGSIFVLTRDGLVNVPPHAHTNMARKCSRSQFVLAYA